MTDDVDRGDRASGTVPVPVAAGEPPDRDVWWLRVASGGALALVGVVLLANPTVAATTLAFIVGLTLVIHGLLELVATPRRTVSVVTGAASIVAGAAAVAWPDATLWIVAVIGGMTCVAVGSLKVTTGLLDRSQPAWRWTVAAGAASVAVGFLALTWPAATALVLALLFGIRTFLVGVVDALRAVAAHRDRVPVDSVTRGR